MDHNDRNGHITCKYSLLSRNISISKSYGPATSSKTINFLHDTKNMTTCINKTFGMTTVAILLIMPLIMFLSGNR